MCCEGRLRAPFCLRPAAAAVKLLVALTFKLNGGFVAMKRLVTAALFAVTTSLLGSCVTNMTTGKQTVGIGSMKSEIERVRKTHEEIVKAYGLYDDQALQDYVNEVGTRVVKHSHMPDAEFKFYVVDQETVNAFTTGCCNVYVHRGLLLKLNSEAELASVLGHESGHVTARHPARQQAKGIFAQVLATGAAIATGSSAVADLASIGAEAWFQGYGRENEMEADRLGMQYAAAAGYRPEAMGEVMNLFKADERFEIDRARTEGREPQIYHTIFDSHPTPDKRAVQAAKGAANISEEPPGGWVENRDIYLHKIEGLAYGSSKAQGIVRDNRMYHGPLGITIAFPKGWTVENQPDRVVAFTPNKDSYVLMRMEAKPANKSPREYLLEAAKTVGVVSGDSFTSNGMEGYAAVTRTGSQIDNGQGPMRVIAMYRGNSVYLFAGASRSYAGGVPEADGLIQSVARTLRGLKPSEFALAEPYRIRLRTATAKTKLADFAAAVPLPKYQKEELELLNNMYPGGNPKPGSVFKTVE